MKFFEYEVIESTAIAVREAAGSYLQGRNALSIATLTHRLMAHEYCEKYAQELAITIQDAAQGGYKRAIFIATRCALKLRDNLPDCVDEIQKLLVEKEQAYLMPEQWYRETDFVNDISALNYADDIAKEIGGVACQEARNAFASGLRRACECFKAHPEILQHAPQREHVW